METQQTGWASMLPFINQMGQEWYSLITQKPLPNRYPPSLMGAITGTDYGQPVVGATQPIGAGLIMLVLVAGAVLLFAKK